MYNVNSSNKQYSKYHHYSRLLIYHLYKYIPRIQARIQGGGARGLLPPPLSTPLPAFSITFKTLSFHYLCFPGLKYIHRDFLQLAPLICKRERFIKSWTFVNNIMYNILTPFSPLFKDPLCSTCCHNNLTQQKCSTREDPGGIID